MDAMLVAIFVLITLSASFGGYYAYERLNATRSLMSARLGVGREGVTQPTEVLVKRRSNVPFVRLLPISAEGREQVQRDLERSGLRWRAQEFLAMRLTLAAVLAIATGVGLSQAISPIAAVMFALLAMAIGWLLPQSYVSRLRKKRLKRVEEQLPDALTAISKSLRAGTGLLQALAFAADETPAPLGPELRSTLRDLQLGAEPVEAFNALSERVGCPDLTIAVTAIIIQRTVGGNLSEILGNVTATIRERAKIQREVRVLTTRQMLQANMTAALPVIVAGLFILISPDIGGTLLTTTAGNIALAFAVVCEVSGIVAVRRLAVIEV